MKFIDPKTLKDKDYMEYYLERLNDLHEAIIKAILERNALYMFANLRNANITFSLTDDIRTYFDNLSKKNYNPKTTFPLSRILIDVLYYLYHAGYKRIPLFFQENRGRVTIRYDLQTTLIYEALLAGTVLLYHRTSPFLISLTEFVNVLLSNAIIKQAVEDVEKALEKKKYTDAKNQVKRLKYLLDNDYLNPVTPYEVFLKVYERKIRKVRAQSQMIFKLKKNILYTTLLCYIIKGADLKELYSRIKEVLEIAELKRKLLMAKEKNQSSES